MVYSNMGVGRDPETGIPLMGIVQHGPDNPETFGKYFSAENYIGIYFPMELK